MKKILLLAFVFLSALCFGQGGASSSNYPISFVTQSGAPSGACPGPNVFSIDFNTPNLYYCPKVGGTWTVAGGGGSGTVTSVTFTGDGTVLSSTPSSAVTTTGTLTAALANAAQNSVLAGPVSGGAAAPTYQTAPTFSAANLTNFPTFNQNTSSSAASLSVTGQTGLFTITGLTSTNRTKTVRDAADTLLELGGSYTPTGTWTSMTLVTPALGTPASGVITSLTGTCTSCVASSANAVNSNTFPASTGFTSGGIPYYSSTSAESSSALLTANVLIKGGGAGAAPTNSSITDNGTIVSTAEPITSGAAGGAPNVDKTVGFLASNMGTYASATLTAITGMTWTLVASKNYYLQCEIVVAQASSSSVTFGLVGPGTPTSYNLDANALIAASYSDKNLLAQSTWVSTALSAFSTNSTTNWFHVNAEIQNGTTPGTLTLDYADPAAAGTIAAQANSVCRLTQAN